MTYATVTECRGYVDAAVTLPADDDDVAKLIEIAERDLQPALRVLEDRDAATGLLITPANLAAWQAAALSRATCAQVEYRVVMGPDFFIRAQHSRVRGPDFTTEGELPYIGPKALGELESAGLQQPRSGSATVPSMLTVDDAQITGPLPL